MHRARSIGFSVLSMLVVCVGLAVPATLATVPDLSSFTGVWEYADGSEGIRRIDAAVSHAVQGMPFFLEAIARRMVRERTGPYEHVHMRVRVRDETVFFATDQWGPVGTRLGAPPVRIVAPEGTRLDLTQRLDRAGRIVQLFNHPDGARENALALSGDRQWLWMSVRITSPKLPHECRFRIRYRRVNRGPRFTVR